MRVVTSAMSEKEPIDVEITHREEIDPQPDDDSQPEVQEVKASRFDIPDDIRITEEHLAALRRVRGKIFPITLALLIITILLGYGAWVVDSGWAKVLLIIGGAFFLMITVAAFLSWRKFIQLEDEFKQRVGNNR